MLRIIKAIFGGTFLLIAIGCLVRLVILLMGRAEPNTPQGTVAANTLIWAFFTLFAGGAAIFFLYSAFRRPRLVTPVNPPL